MNRLLAIVPAFLLFAAQAALAYPIYGSEDTGIRRLEEARLADQGRIKGRKRLPGERLSVDQVRLRLLNHRDFTLPPPDPAFSQQIAALLGGNRSRYGVSVLDFSNPDNPRFAEVNGGFTQNPGSVGKLLAALAVFQALADIYPGDVAKRRAMLRDTVVTADDFIIHDSHTVRFWDRKAGKLTRRPLRIGDTGTLWEWLDWMLSPSSNAAAATVIKQAMLLVHFGKDYPVSHEEGIRFFEETPKQELSALLARTLQQPVTRNGLDLAHLRQGSFFTRTGKRKVPGTSSYATSHELMKYMLRLEEGRLVDEWSSLEIKRLLYMTERRIRYASSPALRSSAVYFKSGSLYACAPEPGFVCRKYHGNKRNAMNSTAIVESPAGSPRLFYIVTLMSNVLRKNSAVDHQTLATRIHRLIEKAHRAPTQTAQ